MNVMVFEGRISQVKMVAGENVILKKKQKKYTNLLLAYCNATFIYHHGLKGIFFVSSSLW